MIPPKVYGINQVLPWDKDTCPYAITYMVTCLCLMGALCFRSRKSTDIDCIYVIICLSFKIINTVICQHLWIKETFCNCPANTKRNNYTSITFCVYWEVQNFVNVIAIVRGKHFIQEKIIANHCCQFTLIQCTGVNNIQVLLLLRDWYLPWFANTCAQLFSWTRSVSDII